jgi:hypothetical protein
MTHTPADTQDEAVRDFPMPRAAGCPFAPPPAMMKLHAEEPVSRVRLWDGSVHWLVTRYEDQRALYGDPHTVFRRIPSLRRAADLDKIPFKDDGIVYGVYELPVTW